MDNHSTDVLQHHGVKGMKWGVRRNLKKAGSTAKDIVVSKYKSDKRERSWRKTDPTGMSDRQLKRQAKRVRLENDLNKLSKGYSGRREYHKRATVSTKDLEKRVQRIQLEVAYNKSSKLATRKQKQQADLFINALKGTTLAANPYAGIGMQLADVVNKKKLG